MPAPLSNLIMAIEAPVSSFRHSIFSDTPLSDFSRHGIASVWTRISSRLGAPAGILTMSILHVAASDASPSMIAYGDFARGPTLFKSAAAKQIRTQERNASHDRHDHHSHPHHDAAR